MTTLDSMPEVIDGLPNFCGQEEQLEAIAAGYDFGPRGPFVEPGEYSIKIKAGDKEATQKVTVEDDPRLQGRRAPEAQGRSSRAPAVRPAAPERQRRCRHTRCRPRNRGRRN